MTADEWFHAYLLRFSTDTISSFQIQEGEMEFLKSMGKDLFPHDVAEFHIHRAFDSIQKSWRKQRSQD